MNRIVTLILLGLLLIGTFLRGQTVIPNAGFEDWTSFGSYSDPVGWDTPNYELNLIPFIGIAVVSKSTDHHGTGSFSAKLETKTYTFAAMDVPGFMTCGKITVDFSSGTFVLSGGVPVTDMPTHLKGYFKYFPKGGDSCVIGIGMTKTTGSIQDTVGLGVFSTKDTIADWTPFSAWIDYMGTAAPDTMNIIAMSTAQEVMTVGTTLYVDDLYLDYTVGFDTTDPSAGISIYNDIETKRLLVFLDFVEHEYTSLSLHNIIGEEISSISAGKVKYGREVIGYSGVAPGIYVIHISHNNKSYTKKFFLNY